MYITLLSCLFIPPPSLMQKDWSHKVQLGNTEKKILLILLYLTNPRKSA